MDERTIAHYERQVGVLAKRYESARMEHHHNVLLGLARPGMRVLDVGCGSGRDVAFLRAKGIDALGIDAAPSMVEAARAQHPESAPHFHVGVLPELDVPAGPFDLVLATAVLMHVPAHGIFDAALRLREQVRPGGQLLVSIPLGRRGDLVEHRDVDGRLFHPYSAVEIQVLFERLCFVLRQKTEDVDGLGRGVAWCTLLLAREAGRGAHRTLEHYEGGGRCAGSRP